MRGVTLPRVELTRRRSEDHEDTMRTGTCTPVAVVAVDLMYTGCARVMMTAHADERKHRLNTPQESEHTRCCEGTRGTSGDLVCITQAHACGVPLRQGSSYHVRKHPPRSDPRLIVSNFRRESFCPEGSDPPQCGLSMRCSCGDMQTLHVW